ncbi:MAG: host attachment protein [Gammaproteobacteria bacterium]|nr:host attachment protein [Gammaproteobacteria bacterium]
MQKSRGASNRGRTNGDFDNLVLVAPPRFLGHLRKSLSGGAAKCVKAEIHKEFTLLDDEDIRTRLADYL